jgi:hypothetical protein
VERWFGFLTDVRALEADIRNWVKAWNNNLKPFVRTKSAEQILAFLEPLIINTINGEGP